MPDVLIVGAGLGGLALAQLLTERGVDVKVAERDPTLAASGRAVRIHCRPFAFDFLDGCSERVRDAFVAGQGSPDARHLYVDERLQPTSIDDRPQPELVLDTLTARRVLALDLGDRLLLGKGAVAVEGGAVRFADGSALEAGVIVGADGAGSTMRTLTTSPPSIRDAHLWSVYGNVDLDAHPGLELPETVGAGFVIVLGEEVKVALGVYEPLDPGCLEASGIEPRRYLFWNLLARPEVFGGGRAETVAELGGLLRPFARSLREAVALTASGTLGFLPLQSSAPSSQPPDSSIILVGDAAHPMLPAALSAAVAFEDARRVADLLGGGDLSSVRADAFAWVREAETLAVPAFGLELTT
jgi:2-polyprenyl-6-methoxyphenol hydroxylase-like FAD-dependent oxidoreductase